RVRRSFAVHGIERNGRSECVHCRSESIRTMPHRFVATHSMGLVHVLAQILRKTFRRIIGTRAQGTKGCQVALLFFDRIARVSAHPERDGGSLRRDLKYSSRTGGE